MTAAGISGGVGARLLIIGPQGSGKGTQGSIVANSFGIPAVVTGDIFRENVRSGTELGVKVQAVIEAGELVSDELTSALVVDRLSKADAAGGFLLDGYPRNRGQLADLDSFLDARTEALTGVIELRVPRTESIKRLGQRAKEQGRADDTEEAISHRLAIFERETAPIIEVYQERGIVLQVDGVGTLDEVTARIFAGLAGLGLKPNS